MNSTSYMFCAHDLNHSSSPNGPKKFRERVGGLSKVTHLLKVVGRSNSVVSIAKAKALSIKSLYSRANHVLRTRYV